MFEGTKLTRASTEDIGSTTPGSTVFILEELCFPPVLVSITSTCPEYA